MSDQKQNENETKNNNADLITVIKEEFSKLIVQQREEFTKKLEEVEKTHNDNIRAIISGRKFVLPPEKKEEPEEKTPEEKLLENLRKDFKINKEKEN